MTDSSQPPERLIRQIEPGERLVWWDRPVRLRLARRAMWQEMPIGVAATAFAAFWLSKTAGAPPPFAYAALPPLLYGLWSLSGPLRAAIRAGRTLYALTDRRALILEGRAMRAFALARIEFVDTSGLAFGADGHVMFQRTYLGRLATPEHLRFRYSKSGFIGVRHAREVAQTLRDLCNRARAGTAPRTTEAA